MPDKKWVYYDPLVQQKEQTRNYASAKTKKVAWFVSNCLFTHNQRNEYVKELQKYIQVRYNFIFRVCIQISKLFNSNKSQCSTLNEVTFEHPENFIKYLLLAIVL